MILTETQTAIRETVRAFAQQEVRPYAAGFEAAGEYPPTLFEALASLGLMGMTAPEADGGAGVDMVSYTLALIELAAGDGALSTIVSIQNSLVVSALLKNGSEDQKARFLPDLLAGRAIGAFALTEADAGSNAAAIRTRAVRRDGGYDDALMLDWRGQVAEATGANIFFVRQGVVHTPLPDCFLDGITRRTVIAILRNQGVEVVERAIWPEELAQFEQCFVTGSAAEVTPVREIGPWSFEVGAFVQDVRKAYSHSGTHQITRRIKKGTIEPNYEADEVLEVLRFAGTMALMALAEIAQMAGKADLVAEIQHRVGPPKDGGATG